MLSAIFIDVDNTLLSFDEYVRKAMRTGFEKFGLPPYKEEYYEIFDQINDKYWEDIERGKLTFEELKRIRWNRVFEEIGVTFDGEVFETFFRTYLNESAICEPGAEELLRHLCQRYVLCVASNGPYEQQIQRLKIGGLYPYFTYFFVGAHRVSKALREVFRRVLSGA